MSGITISADSGTEFTANAAEWNSVCRLDDNSYAVAYRDNNDGNKGKVNVGSRTGTSVTISELNAVVFNNDATDRIQIVSLTSTLVVISYRDINSTRPYVVACTISGTTITVGTAILIVATAPQGISVCSLDATDFVVSVGLAGNLKSWVGSVSGTVISLGTTQDSLITGVNIGTIGLDGTHFAWVVSGNFNSLYAGVSSVDVGLQTITWGTATATLGAVDTLYIVPMDKFDSQHFAIAATYSGSAQVSIHACSANLGTLVTTLGTVLSSGSTGQSNLSLCCVTANNFIVSYYQATGTQAEARSGTLTGSTTIAWDAQGPQIFDNTTTAYTSICRLTNDYFIVGYKEG